MIRALLLGILLLVVARAFWKLADGVLEALGGAPRRRGQMPGVKLLRDPVCGTYVAPDHAVPLTVGPMTHYFCSDACRDRYRKERTG